MKTTISMLNLGMRGNNSQIVSIVGYIGIVSIVGYIGTQTLHISPKSQTSSKVAIYVVIGC